MKEAMGPPPRRNPNPSDSDTNHTPETQINPQKDTSSSVTMKVPMGPPPPKNPNPPKTDTDIHGEVPNTTPDEPQSNDSKIEVTETEEKLQEDPKPPKPSSNSTSGDSGSIAVPYTIPPWSQPPSHPFFLEVLKDGSIIDQFDVSEKGAYMFGRVDLCDFVLEHPTISRFHAVIQFKQNGDAYLYDLGSTHGTSINKNQVKKRTYTDLHVGDVVRFGQSSRLYIFQGPSELMPPESDFNKIRTAKMREEMQDREASLRRAKLEASLADGISWGITEDAIEEAEEDTDEVTWQTFKGQLTERQEKTRDKILKRTEKARKLFIANMKKEIDAIRSKDIAQGGLTQGQQTQIARNEQRISQILEELESLEETLNESIQESIGARAGKVHGKKKGAIEDEDEAPSDDDEFYDRTKKKPIQKAGENASVETADTLLDKKDAIMKEMENKSNLLLNEKARMTQEVESATESGDALDAYMTGLSSQLVLDTTTQLQRDISALQSKLDRILYLLKIADPTGEASKRRNSKLEASKSNQPDITSPIVKQLPTEKKTTSTTSQKPKDGSIPKKGNASVTTQEQRKPLEADTSVTEVKETKTPVYTVTKPLWLGATDNIEKKEIQPKEVPLVMNESDQFVDYKDRKKTLESVNDAKVNPVSGIEDAAPGLIIRKRKQAEEPEENDDKAPETSTSLSVEAASAAADAVALLLKHKRGYLASDDMETNESTESVFQSKKETKSRRVLGPERPIFLDNNNPDYETWVPPEGQSGDGRTSLNDRYGY
ncbi:Forkhead-associated (FHA) domain [Macleaya cordata]|uniref:Forkhead-associated (FHA) domain n=1 Tax=Macleaya cordata TaxID=56857 RepID=A0A200R2F1_MACCD|nr:Forkhead-associated (FHA) domain [Macleaya cordata]